MSPVPTGGSPLARLSGVPATVVGGYLGSGKTTLINGWLQAGACQGWALLVNDLGSINVDAERLRQGDGRVLELGGGCVCCTLRDGLGAALVELARRELPPAHVLIETSGMALPERVASQLQLHGLALARVLLVVDLERIEALWHDRWVGELVQQQFDGVDLLQFSKGDLLPPGEAERRQQWLRQQLESRAQHPAPPFHSERQLVRSDAWLQLEPLERSQVLAWAAQLSPELLRAKGEVWLTDAPDGPVRFDRAGDRLTLATAPSRPWSHPLQRRGHLVAISRADAAAPRWPSTFLQATPDPSSPLIPA
ncbi:GTP-binding protein [Synechococcus sp. CCY9201]|uniref:CobW family GTP-binding protein n=1 Tax=Synechococcus sp. CCY9201 TaxID=174697 RepID=UPI002B20E145|nr:GTP-binding protein [Synechococcus sp. CCY9201]MEA5473564.1 GTP-binding protein [Synechococcus sp. CCY9201]